MIWSQYKECHYILFPLHLFSEITLSQPDFLFIKALLTFTILCLVSRWLLDFPHNFQEDKNPLKMIYVPTLSLLPLLPSSSLGYVLVSVLFF